MSETLSQDQNQGPETLPSGYTLTPSYPSATTISDQSGLNLPPFSTFTADIESNGSFNTFGDARLLDISNWDCYTETRLERTDNGISIITSQPQYRPWESKPLDTGGVTTFADAFATQNGAGPRLPSFQSQFHAFNEQVTANETTTLTTLTPVSPNSTNQNITALSNFHALNSRNYPLVPAPIQAREIPIMDDRHIQLYSHSSGFPQNGTVIQNIGTPAMVTVLKSEPIHQLQEATGIKIQNIATLHHSQFQNPMSTLIDNNVGNNLYNQIDKKSISIAGSTNNGNIISASNIDYRKKERRKMRASSLESSNESDGASSNMDIASAENSGQVAAISSTASFKHQSNTSSSSSNVNMNARGAGVLDIDEISGGVDKQVKKKRKRCGECIGCQRKDNCGDCAPCRNDKSHQICKQRRCEKLTEKKNLYGENGFVRDGSRRGRGKSRRGGGIYRGRKTATTSSSQTNMSTQDSSTIVKTSVSGMNEGEDLTSTTIHQPTSIQRVNIQNPQHISKFSTIQSTPAVETVAVALPVLSHQPITGTTAQQPSSLTAVPFYTEPNRFTTAMWQTDPSPPWTQGQFIQQVGSTTSSPMDTAYSTQQYPNSIYQPTMYTQHGFEQIAANTYYTGAVQVLTNRPPTVLTQQSHSQQLPPRTCGSTASYTPSPSPSHQSSRPQSTHQLQYENYQFSTSATMPTTPSDSHSRPSSANSNAPTSSVYCSTSQQQQNNSGYSPGRNNPGSFVSANAGTQAGSRDQVSGNGSPGYITVDCSSGTNDKQPSPSHEVSMNTNVYSGYNNDGILNNLTLSKKWSNSENIVWENIHPNRFTEKDGAKLKVDKLQSSSDHEISSCSSDHLNQHRVEINSKLKTMILNKQEKKIESDEHNNKTTGHFLWNSHHYCAMEELGNGGKKYFRIQAFLKVFRIFMRIEPGKYIESKIHNIYIVYESTKIHNKSLHADNIENSGLMIFGFTHRLNIFNNFQLEKYF